MKWARWAVFGAGLSVVFLLVVSVLSYRSDAVLIDLWDRLQARENSLFLIREDQNDLNSIEHRLHLGEVVPTDEIKDAGLTLSKTPSLGRDVSRKKKLLEKARDLLEKGRLSDAKKILTSEELIQIDQRLRQSVFDHEIDERASMTQDLSARLESQERIILFDFLGIVLGVTLFVFSAYAAWNYISRLRRIEGDLRRARMDAEKASRMKSEFLANMSHEIRTPINGVLGLSTLLKETQLSTEQRDYVESLAACGDQLLNLLNEVLDLSKIEAGKFELEKVPFSVDEWLDNLEKTFSILAEKKGLRLEFVREGTTRRSLGDPLKLSRILSNLLSNAIKFTEQGSVRLRWTTREDGPMMWHHFEIRDTGVGIPLDAQKKIFEPFTQADSSTSRVFGGTGLGLTLVRRFTVLLGGQISFESREGLGTVFRVEIPFESESTSQANVSPPASPDETQKNLRSGLRVLIVEDNEINARIMERLLASRGLDLDLARSGPEALEKIKRKLPDLILMDCHLPGMDGLEATRRIRQGDSGDLARQVSILALTASALKEDREACLAAGMNGFMTKPVAPAEVFEQIAAHQDNRPSALVLERLEDPALTVELLEIFLSEAPARLAEARASIQSQSWEKAGRAAHTLKSASRQLGFDELADVCEQIERRGLKEKNTIPHEDLSQLESEIQKALVRCRHWIRIFLSSEKTKKTNTILTKMTGA